jgi:hypothetical protein
MARPVRPDREKELTQLADRRADLWLQGQRIAKYLPTFYRQRLEALRRLADLDQLVAAVEAIEKQVA